MKRIWIGCLFLAGIELLSGSPAKEDATGPGFEWIKTLDAKGAFISLEGNSLFLTSGIDNKKTEQQPGSWFDLAADPAAPELLCATLPAAWQVAIARDHAFVCDYTKFLRVYDIRGHQWKNVAELPMPAQTENIVIRGNLAYIANHIAGLTIVDISAPSAPAIVSNVNPGIDCDGVALWKDSAILYAHWESRLVVVDVSDSAKPRRISAYQHTPSTFNQGELEVANGFAYCTAVNSLVIVDLTDAAHPKLASALPFKNATTDVAIREGYAFVAGSDGISVLDVTDPANAVKVSSCNQPSFQLAVVAGPSKGEYFVYTTSRKGLAAVWRFSAPARQPAVPRQ